MGIAKDIDLKNIKKAKTGGYQIQFIVNGKSHSGFSMDLAEAVKIRDKLRKKLKVVPNGAFKKTNQQSKKSLVPGTRHQMAVGITFTSFMSRGYETYYILVNWKDFEGKHKTKSFYCGRESTYTIKKAKEIYKKALEFRKSYEAAVLEGKVKEFYAKSVNIKSVNINKKPKKNAPSNKSSLVQNNARLSRNSRTSRRKR